MSKTILDLEELNNKYSYLSDGNKYKTKFDIWELPEANANGEFQGDCESYCRLLKNNTKEFKDWSYYYCKLNNEGHCVLFKNGNIIDCNIRRVVSFDQYCKFFRYNVTDFKKYNKLQILSKILFSKIFLTWRRLVDIWQEEQK